MAFASLAFAPPPAGGKGGSETRQAIHMVASTGMNRTRYRRRAVTIKVSEDGERPIFLALIPFFCLMASLYYLHPPTAGRVVPGKNSGIMPSHAYCHTPSRCALTSKAESESSVSCVMTAPTDTSSNERRLLMTTYRPFFARTSRRGARCTTPAGKGPLRPGPPSAVPPIANDGPCQPDG